MRAVTGRPLAEEVRERLLDPLELESAWFQAEEDPRAKGTVAYRLVAASGGALRPVPVARKSDVMPFRSVITAAGGAGSLAATAEDAALGIQTFAGGDVLTPAMQREMLADVARTPPSSRGSRTAWASRRCRSRGVTLSGTRAVSWASGTWCATCRLRA